MQRPINAAKHPTIVKPKVAAPVQPAPSAAPAPKPQAAAAPASGNALKAPLPGTITSVNVKVGDTVNVGDVVIILEAMKMQNNIEAETAGTITAINVTPGDSVMEGSVLLTIG
jgi:biotin carboxyl carrier protein